MIWSSNYCSYLKRENLIRRTGTQDGRFFFFFSSEDSRELPGSTLVLCSGPDRIEASDAISQAMPAESPNNTLQSLNDARAGRDGERFPEKQGTMLFACVALRVRGFK